MEVAAEINAVRSEMGGGSPNLNPYCVTGAGTDITTIANTVNLATEQVPDSNYSLNTNEITVTTDGVYFISYAIQIDEDTTAGSTRRRCNAFVEVNAALIPQSENSTYLRESSGGGGISNGVFVILPESAVVRLRVQMDAAGPDTSVETAQLSLAKFS